MLRYLTAGESHGPALMGILEGMPAGVPVTVEGINSDLKRRKGGHGRGGRMKIEDDTVQIMAGVRHGRTLGSPIGLLIHNRDWANWSHIMSPEPLVNERAGDPEGHGAGPDPARSSGMRVLTRPRPGHADLIGGIKYGHHDFRNVLERASARETAMRVAIGAVCHSLLEAVGIRVIAHVVEIGGVAARTENLSIQEIAALSAESPVYCADREAGAQMVQAIDKAKGDGDTLGGVFEVIAIGVPPGLGSHVASDRKLDARLAAEVIGIQAIKGVEVGLGFGAARRPGSQVHDEILPAGQPRHWTRPSNRAGGIEGGMSNSEPIVVRAAMKPIATLYKPLRSLDIRTGEPVLAGVERSDTCAVPAASVVGRAAVSFVLAQALLEKFGGDNLSEITRNLASYSESVGAFFGGGPC